jgi:hydroxymethylpyrimidine/phosphomethylpyrimidine kinase
MLGRVLIVAGSDSGGGAGIQADIKTVTALGGYAMTAITALTAQNTLGVFGIVAIDPAFVGQQMELVLSDIGADVIKTGMLHSRAVIDVVADRIESFASRVPLVVDPVMVAKGGASLIEPNAQSALRERLLPRAALITPNAPEAAALTGVPVARLDDLARAADRLLTLGAAAVLVKGGHLDGDVVVDLLRTADGTERRFEAPRLETRSTHGTGCTLASAIAAGIADGLTLEHAVERGHAYLQKALRTAPGLGQGHGPLNHMHTLPSFAPATPAKPDVSKLH